jgi:hypothetical protein
MYLTGTQIMAEGETLSLVFIMFPLKFFIITSFKKKIFELTKSSNIE